MQQLGYVHVEDLEKGFYLEILDLTKSDGGNDNN